MVSSLSGQWPCLYTGSVCNRHDPVILPALAATVADNSPDLPLQAPELLNNRPFTEKVDIYSIGVILEELWELCTAPRIGKLRDVRCVYPALQGLLRHL